jgi:hypothetical protein
MCMHTYKTCMYVYTLPFFFKEINSPKKLKINKKHNHLESIEKLSKTSSNKCVLKFLNQKETCIKFPVQIFFQRSFIQHIVTRLNLIKIRSTHLLPIFYLFFFCRSCVTTTTRVTKKKER